MNRIDYLYPEIEEYLALKKHSTAWNYVRTIFKGYYPHFFRFNFITESARDPEVSLAELGAKTGLNLQTLNAYLMKDDILQDQLDRRKLEKIDEQSSYKKGEFDGLLTRDKNQKPLPHPIKQEKKKRKAPAIKHPSPPEQDVPPKKETNLLDEILAEVD